MRWSNWMVQIEWIKLNGSTCYVTRDVRNSPWPHNFGGRFLNNLICSCWLSLYQISQQRLKFRKRLKKTIRKFRCINTLNGINSQINFLIAQILCFIAISFCIRVYKYYNFERCSFQFVMFSLDLLLGCYILNVIDLLSLVLHTLTLF